MPVIPAALGSTNKRLTVQACPGIKWDPYLKNKLHKKGQQNGSSDRAPACKHKALSSTSNAAKKINLSTDRAHKAQIGKAPSVLLILHQLLHTKFL
jgi:hypothetical protein